MASSCWEMGLGGVQKGYYKNLSSRCNVHEVDKLMSVSQVESSRLNLLKSCREEF